MRGQLAAFTIIAATIASNAWAQTAAPVPDVRIWTDDYSNILGAILRKRFTE